MGGSESRWYTNVQRERERGKKGGKGETKENPDTIKSTTSTEEISLSRLRQDFIQGVNNSIVTGRSFVSRRENHLSFGFSQDAPCTAKDKMMTVERKRWKNGSPFKGHVQVAYICQDYMTYGSNRTTSGRSVRGVSHLCESLETNIPIFISGSTSSQNERTVLLRANSRRNFISSFHS